MERMVGGHASATLSGCHHVGHAKVVREKSKKGGIRRT